MKQSHNAIQYNTDPVTRNFKMANGSKNSISGERPCFSEVSILLIFQANKSKTRPVVYRGAFGNIALALKQTNETMEKAGKLFSPTQPFCVATELFSPE